MKYHTIGNKKVQFLYEKLHFFDVGGRDGIRTHVPVLQTTAFRVRLVATTSILFQCATILPQNCRKRKYFAQIIRRRAHRAQNELAKVYLGQARRHNPPWTWGLHRRILCSGYSLCL